MPSTQWQFVLEQGTDAAALVMRAGSTRLHPAGVIRLERTWLDTFDWRLHADGLLLELIDTADERRAALSWQETGELVSQAAVAGLPRWPSDLPAGPLREHVAASVEIRALLPVGTVTVSRRSWRLRDGQNKTVARVDLDEPARSNGASDLMPRLHVRALRGYERQGKRLAAALAQEPGVIVAARHEAFDVMASHGRVPGTHSGKVDVALDPWIPAEAAFQRILLHLLDTMEDNVDGTVADLDTEFLHDFRVAVRRSRSAVKLATDVLTGPQVKRFAAELKWLGDLTTPVRDLDVHLLEHDVMAARLPVPGALDPLRTLLERHRIDERRTLVRALRSQRFKRFVSDYRAWLNTAPTDNPDSEGTQAIQAVANELVRKAYRKVLRRGRATERDLSPERLHDLRKRGKELRYALEFFASLYDAGDLKRVIKELKLLQDVLGAYQDSHVQLGVMDQYAQELATAGVSAETVLAMGRLSSDIDKQQSRAQADFASRFGRFDSGAVAKRMKRLVRS